MIKMIIMITITGLWIGYLVAYYKFGKFNREAEKWESNGYGYRVVEGTVVKKGSFYVNHVGANKGSRVSTLDVSYLDSNCVQNIYHFHCDAFITPKVGQKVKLLMFEDEVDHCLGYGTNETVKEFFQIFLTMFLVFFTICSTAFALF